MGVVFEAVDEQMNRPVALKVLMGDFEADPEARARFYREARAAARLVHPKSSPCTTLAKIKDARFIAMQLLQGAPLPMYLKQPEAASLERKLDLMIQVLGTCRRACGRDRPSRSEAEQPVRAVRWCFEDPRLRCGARHRFQHDGAGNHAGDTGLHVP